MTNEIRQRGVPNWQKQAWLTEYQVCQQDNSSTASNYWTMAGIFIGISSVLLAGIIYVILAGKVFQDLFQGGITADAQSQVLVLRIIVLVLGTGTISIIVFLFFWLKRVNYLADRNYERMREIELELGMWKSWRVHSIDRWNELHISSSDTLDDKRIDEIWNILQEKLEKGLPKKYLGKLKQRKEELVRFCNRYRRQRWYEHPSRNVHYKVILGILIVLWLIAIIVVWVLPSVMDF